MKRRDLSKRSDSERRAGDRKHYDMCLNDAVKGKSNINPLFTCKPYASVRKVVERNER